MIDEDDKKLTVQQAKHEMAKVVANKMAEVCVIHPADVQVASAILLLQALMTRHIPQEKRLAAFDVFVKGARDNIKNHGDQR